MQYFILDQNSVVDYINRVTDLRTFFCDDAIEASEIGDGNLNHVWILRGQNSGKSLVLKQALPYLRCVGEEYPLSRDRMKFEIRSLLEYEKLAPAYIPKIYHSNEDMSLVVMQNLDNHVIMRKGVLESVRYPKFAEQISDFLARALFYSSSLYASSREKREEIVRFADNVELCKLTEDFVFTFPYMENETNHHNPCISDAVESIRKDGVFKQKAMELKYLFMNKPDSLIHGDLHTGSIMLNTDETFVIDSEFAFYGPMGFDVGAVFGNLLMAYCSYFVREDKAYQQWLLDTAFAVLEKFFAKFRALWDEAGESALYTEGYFAQCGEEYFASYKEDFLRKILQETVGFAGCKMMRRQMGIAHVLDIDSIEDLDKRAIAEKAVIRIAREFVVGYAGIENLEDIRQIVINRRAF